jgi:adenylate cyclase
MTLGRLQFRRFSTRLICLLLGLLAAVLASVYLMISQANLRNAIEHSESNLELGSRVFDRAILQRIESLANSASVMSQDYGIRSVLLQEKPDRATLSSNLKSYTQRVHAPVIALFEPEGRLLANSDAGMDNENSGPFAYLIRQAAAQDKDLMTGFAYLNRALHVLVVRPLYAPYPEIAAWFGLAFPIDEEFAREIKRLTLLDVTFATVDETGGARLLASTLPAGDAGELLPVVAENARRPVRLRTLTLTGGRYVTLLKTQELLGGDSPVTVVLQRPLASELAAAHDLENIVVLISLAALAVATLAALWIARGVSQPLQQLADHTKHVATGDYSQRITLKRADELGQLATAFNQMTAGLAERDRVRDLLGKVVSPEIATQLLQSDLKLGGEEREVTIMFCDLRDFTGMSEKMVPADILNLLNRYLDRMSTVIEKHGGVIDKYIGDAIMALFGAPVADPGAAAKAIAAAREMAQALNIFNRELIAEGRPALAFGIGINTARVVAGNMGSKTRLNYTVIGDGVNLASRLEALTKEPAYDTPIIVSEATFRTMQNPPPSRLLGEVHVKGKAESVKIYALGAKGESQPPFRL